MQLFNEATMNAPWGLAARVKLVRMALSFFDVEKREASFNAIGKALPRKGAPGTLTGDDFLKYVIANGNFQRQPNTMRVAQILERMVTDDLLIRARYGNPSLGGVGDHFLHAAMKWHFS